MASKKFQLERCIETIKTPGSLQEELGNALKDLDFLLADNNDSAEYCEVIIQADIVPYLIKTLLSCTAPGSVWASSILINISFHNVKVLIENDILGAYLQLLACDNPSIFKKVCCGLGNIAFDCQEFLSLVDAPSVLATLVGKFVDGKFSDDTFRQISRDFSHCLRGITFHTLPFDTCRSTLLLCIEIVKEWLSYPEQTVLNAFDSIWHIAFHSGEQVMLYLCINEWECVEKMISFHDKHPSVNLHNEFIYIISEVVYYLEDEQKIALLLEKNLLGIFLEILNTSYIRNAKYKVCLSINNLSVQHQRCETIFSCAELIRKLIELFPHEDTHVQEEICFIFANCVTGMVNRDLGQQYSPFLVNCGLLELLYAAIQSEISKSCLERTLFCLEYLLQAGEFFVDHENVLFNEYVLRFAEIGGHEALLNTTKKSNLARAILVNSFGSAFEQFTARKRGFKIKKAL